MKCFTFVNGEFQEGIPYNFDRETQEWVVDGVEIIDNNYNSNFSQVEKGITPILNHAISVKLDEQQSQSSWILVSTQEYSGDEDASCVLLILDHLETFFKVEEITPKIWLVKPWQKFYFKSNGFLNQASWRNEQWTVQQFEIRNE